MTHLPKAPSNPTFCKLTQIRTRLCRILLLPKRAQGREQGVKAGPLLGKKTTLTKVYRVKLVSKALPGSTIPTSFKERQGLRDGSELRTEEG